MYVLDVKHKNELNLQRLSYLGRLAFQGSSIVSLLCTTDTESWDVEIWPNGRFITKYNCPLFRSENVTMGDNTCPLWKKTHRPHNHNGELRMDRNRCPFFFFFPFQRCRSDQSNGLVTSAHHSYFVEIFCRLFPLRIPGDLRRPTEYSRRPVCESCTPGRSFIVTGVTAYLGW